MSPYQIKESQQIPNLHGSLKLVMSRMPASFASSKNLHRIEQLAAELPSIHLAGFEYQLGAPDRGMDFQQGILVTEESRKSLNQFSSIQHLRPNHLLMQSLGSYLDHCLQPGAPLFNQVKQVWLEYDTGLGQQTKPAAIFVALQNHNIAGEQQLKAINQTCKELTGAELDQQSNETVAKIINTAKSFDGVSNIGFLAGRPGKGLRLVLPFRDQAGLKRLITAISREVPASQMAAALSCINPALKDRRLCVDILGHQVGGFALECFFPDYLPDEAYRKLLKTYLDNWVQLGWCSSAEASGLVSWLGDLHPPDNPQDWPDDMLLKTLGMPEDYFLRLQCGLSHLKLANWNDGWQTKKVYFGYRESTLAFEEVFFQRDVAG